jgi:hypothetical protein
VKGERFFIAPDKKIYKFSDTWYRAEKNEDGYFKFNKLKDDELGRMTILLNFKKLKNVEAVEVSKIMNSKVFL